MFRLKNYESKLRNSAYLTLFGKAKCVSETVHFFSCLFTIFQINYRLSNTFWLYQHRIKYAPFLSYSLFCNFSNWTLCTYLQNFIFLIDSCAVNGNFYQCQSFRIFRLSVGCIIHWGVDYIQRSKDTLEYGNTKKTSFVNVICRLRSKTASLQVTLILDTTNRAKY